MMVQSYRTWKAWSHLWDLFLSDPALLRKDLHLLLHLITLLWNLWGIWGWLHGMSRGFMAGGAYQPFLCIIPFWRKAFSGEITNTEAENRSARSGRSFKLPLCHWAHPLPPPLSWDIKKTSAPLSGIVCHRKWLDKLRSLLEIELAEWVREGICKWVALAIPTEACVPSQWCFLKKIK